MRVHRMIWWLAVPIGVALGLALAIGIDRAASPAAGASKFTVSAEQLRINQRIGQAGVRRANRANSRIDQLKSGPTGPAGPAGPAGPPGPGAGRIAFSAAAGALGQTVLELAGVTLTATCEAGGAGEAALAVRIGAAEATTVFGTSIVDFGTDPNNPTATEAANFQTTVPAGPPTLLGGAATAPDGEFFRVFSRLLFVTATRTLSLEVSVFADGAADRCSLNGVAVPS